MKLKISHINPDSLHKNPAFSHAIAPLEIPGKGTFAIYLQGGVDHGLWQL
jgi:hypothetical protein